MSGFRRIGCSRNCVGARPGKAQVDVPKAIDRLFSRTQPATVVAAVSPDGEGNIAMSKRVLSRRSVLTTLVALLVGLLAPWASVEAREPIGATALVELTGLDRALEEVATGLAGEGARIVGQGEEIGDKDQFKAAWEQAATEAFASAKLKESLARRIDGKLTPAELVKIEDFYKGKLGRAMVAREIAAGSVKSQQEMMTGAEKMMRALSTNPKRIVALESLSRAIRLKEVSTGIALNMMRAVMIGMAAANTDKLKMPLDVIEEQVEQHRLTASQEMEAVTALSMTYTYRSASVDDIKAYEKFLRSPAGRRFNDVAMGGLDAVLSEGGLAFGNALVRFLNRTPI